MVVVSVMIELSDFDYLHVAVDEVNRTTETVRPNGNSSFFGYDFENHFYESRNAHHDEQ